MRVVYLLGTVLLALLIFAGGQSRPLNFRIDCDPNAGGSDRHAPIRRTIVR